MKERLPLGSTVLETIAFDLIKSKLFVGLTTLSCGLPSCLGAVSANGLTDAGRQEQFPVGSTGPLGRALKECRLNPVENPGRDCPFLPSEAVMQYKMLDETAGQRTFAVVLDAAMKSSQA